ncbi:hypothetical protein [Streptomyces lydicus]|uniref:hypothetical protein n=1 Tax=Streptomyces lydicus TaxID=47763 RepID=UPI0036EC0D72
MPTKKPSRPWRLVLSTQGAPVETKHRSCPEAYRAVAAEKERIATGSSRVTRIRVEQWSVEYGRWDLYERAYPEQ